MDPVNHALSSLGATICCSVPSSDSHPASCLLEAGAWLADSFIKPPVRLTLHLAGPVRLRSLAWRCRVGSQCTELQEVWATSGPPGPCSPHCPAPPAARPGDWYRLGRGHTQEGDRVEFINRRVVAEAGSAHRLGCRDERGLLEHVTALRLEILYTRAASTPCMAELRVLGSAVMAAGRDQVGHLTERAGQGGGQVAPTFTFFGGSAEEASPQIPAASVEATVEAEGGEEVPEEFLDSITQEVMSLPMTLPSGHTVDRTSLDRCSAAMASWGGPPRDPYTGRKYRDGARPVFNPGLKARIDRWLLGREGQQSAVGRTVGSAQAISRFLEGKGSKRKLGGGQEDDSVSKHGKVIVIGDEDDDEGSSTSSESRSDLDRALSQTLSQIKSKVKY